MKFAIACWNVVDSVRSLVEAEVWLYVPKSSSTGNVVSDGGWALGEVRTFGAVPCAETGDVLQVSEDCAVTVPVDVLDTRVDVRLAV